MQNKFTRLNNFLKKDIWHIDLNSLSLFKSILVKTTKITYFTIRESIENELTLRAMSLVYTTLLSIVPLIALSFSVLKAFGVVDSQLQPLLLELFSPLGEKGHEITQRIMEFISNMKVGVLGTIGLIVLIWTVFSLIKKVDDTINLIWKVKEGRNIIRRFNNYISLTLIGPIFLFAIFALTASLASNTIVKKISSIEPFGTLLVMWGRILPYIVVSSIFTFIYIIVPNTKVHFRSALLGGIVAGILWQITGTFFAYGVASSTKYFAIYSSLAVLILFMIWVYLGWLILLIGAQLAYCHQNINISGLKLDLIELGSGIRERLALEVMLLIAREYLEGNKGLTVKEIVELLSIPYNIISKTVTDLKVSELLVETSDEPPRYIPARDLGKIKVKEIIYAIRTTPSANKLTEIFRFSSELEKIYSQIENCVSNTLGEITTRDILVKTKTNPQHFPRNRK